MTLSARTPLLAALAAALAVTAWLALRDGGLAPAPAGAPATPAAPASPAAPAQPGVATVDPSVAERLADPIAVPRDAVAAAASKGVDALGANEREAYDRYVAEIEAAIRKDAPAIKSLIADYTAGLMNKDVDALAGLWATDEGTDPRAAAAARIDSLPQIVSSKPQQTVTAFAVGSTTVYTAFAVVVWRDAGIDSEHTIVIPLRRTASGWRLTGLDPTRAPTSFVVTTVTSI
ncbi:MAG: hypothetical protein H5T75_06950 [Coriobacteriia bacterium]|nr:hypothetical protein [Coriobacteriia bacterium]